MRLKDIFEKIKKFKSHIIVYIVATAIAFVCFGLVSLDVSMQQSQYQLQSQSTVIDNNISSINNNQNINILISSLQYTYTGRFVNVLESIDKKTVNNVVSALGVIELLTLSYINVDDQDYIVYMTTTNSKAALKIKKSFTNTVFSTNVAYNTKKATLNILSLFGK